MRNSFISGELKEISLSRLRISFAVRGRLRPFARIDLHQNGVVRVAFAHQRRQRRITGIAAVPVRFAVDLDRMEHGRQAGRGKQDVGVDLLVAEDVAAAGPHIGRGDEQLDRGAGQPVEIDALIED
jgi:hypothetical protein